jgi:hypothetical protein
VKALEHPYRAYFRMVFFRIFIFQAHKIAAELESRYPEDTSVQFSYLPALWALDALNQDDPAKALDMTKAAVPYDLAVPGTAYFTGASFLRSSLSGLRAWTRLFPDGEPLRRRRRISKNP